MAIKKPEIDAVIVGLGWVGSILAAELTEAGLNVVALERGPDQDTPDDASYPKVIDELAYTVRGKLYQDLSKETVTIRHTPSGIAVPYRQQGTFLLGNGVGGAGFHWNGLTWRPLPSDLKLRSHYTERYGKNMIPDNMTIQDHGVSYEELEPFFTRFEDVAGVSGKAGNIKGQLIEGGNQFEGPRSKEFPLPPLKPVYGDTLFETAAKQLGYSPFKIPAGNASGPYTNPYGVRLGPCNFCGFCENYGCYMYSKASPQTTILPALRRRKNFELRPLSHVTKVNLDSTGKQATGVTYIDAQGNETEQPARLVILSAFQLHNVRLLLLSGIGKPYNPQTGEGLVGKNYGYQMLSSINVVMPKGTYLNPFIGTGAGGSAIDNYNGDNFDHTGLGFIGGANIGHHRTGGRPIGQSSVAKGAPNWGKGWKAAVADNYQRSLNIYTQGSVMAYRDSYVDLDPTYRDSFGQPLLRVTFNWHDNDIKMSQYVTGKAEEIVKAMKPDSYQVNVKKLGTPYDTRFYQSTHTTGGAIMGTSPSNSVVNRYLQSWDVPNLFVIGASAFPQNIGYNPTGLVGALAYWSANAIRQHYLKNPGKPLVEA
ncbi:GMC family oxidoreductase [Pseudomonas sp. GD03842]|uniref:GMC family oxidoreductase n=1 Tax=unclassified Pseudomonas TaxID=196821 RepID=UPI000D336C3F|nr:MULTISPECIES: GMC family oxidoreductase [unclassified Pseudomonas]MDH0746860.1 GMC family oxidoreductase [Pseudomonas sp. GD03842]RAU43892.1 GMC family oxidoreductase [Pseudomonas sp. RIT 409]RAU56214.1 GMC family oxidoreductase [Pseudomonas sp. RIT 412]